MPAGRGRAGRRAVAGKISDWADVMEAGTGAPNHCRLGGWAHSRQHSDQFV
jgi:hypothetical protein